MPTAAGKFKHRVLVEVLQPPSNGWGGHGTYEPVTPAAVRCNIKADTGMSAIRSGLTSGVPQSVGRYSVLMRERTLRYYGIPVGARLRPVGAAWANLRLLVQGITPDTEDGTRVYLHCTDEAHANKT